MKHMFGEGNTKIIAKIRDSLGRMSDQRLVAAGKNLRWIPVKPLLHKPMLEEIKGK